MIELSCSIDIRAPLEVVWQALTDLPRFCEWNPFIREASGEPRAGGRVRVRVQPSVAIPVVFHADVLRSVERRELRWRGHFLAPWLASGEHTFTLEPRATGGVHFVQREVFRGLLPWLVGRPLAREAMRGFQAMNRALRVRAEGACSAPERASCADS
jgi:hypothetical protein